MTDIQKQKFICIDCETTGLDPQNDRVIEIAVMCFDASGQIFAEKEALINPECEIPEPSMAIHHITNEMVKDQPTIASLLPEILEMIGKHIIIGHGVKFDIDILAAEAARHGIPCTIQENIYLCTLRMARWYGQSPINSLASLGKHFNIPQDGAHRAMNDVVVNQEVFRKLLKSFKTTDHLFDVLSKPISMNSMPFGKHKGRAFKDIPLQYLQWLVNKDFDQDLIFSAKKELQRRKKGNLFSQSGNPFAHL